MDVLTIGKVMDYAYQKVYGEGGNVDKEAEKIDCKNCLEILCMNQVRIYILIVNLIHILHNIVQKSHSVRV